MSSFVPIPNFMSDIPQTVLTPRKWNLYSEKFVDISKGENITFFTDPDRPIERTNMPSAGMLGAPLAFDLEQLVVTFLTRMPNAILEDISGEMKVGWEMGIRPVVDERLSDWNRSIVDANELKVERAPFEIAWIDNGRSFRRDIVQYNNGEPEPMHIVSNISFRGTLLHNAIREDIPRFLIRMTMKGVLWLQM